MFRTSARDTEAAPVAVTNRARRSAFVLFNNAVPVAVLLMVLTNRRSAVAVAAPVALTIKDLTSDLASTAAPVAVTVRAATRFRNLACVAVAVLVLDNSLPAERTKTAVPVPLRLRRLATLRTTALAPVATADRARAT